MTENDDMFLAAAFCPSPPLLHPRVLGASGADMGSQLHSACADALDRMLGIDPDAVLVLGAGPADLACARGDVGDLIGYGVPVQIGFDGPPASNDSRVPLAHTLGAWLLDDAGFAGQRLGLAAGTESRQMRAARTDGRRWAMLVMGDDSARRSERSPGWYDPDAVAFDDAVTAALHSGDAKALLDLDARVGARVLAAGTASWQTVGGILAGLPMVSRVHYADAPFGVFYVVASWVVPDLTAQDLTAQDLTGDGAR